MNNLKTLKDIQADVPISQIEDVDSFLLRQEAIKWVQREQKKLPETWFDYCEIMIEFFNLTEDDLKQTEKKDE
jgi:hypothetical protein